MGSVSVDMSLSRLVVLKPSSSQDSFFTLLGMEFRGHWMRVVRLLLLLLAPPPPLDTATVAARMFSLSACCRLDSETATLRTREFCAEDPAEATLLTLPPYLGMAPLPLLSLFTWA